MSLDPQLLALMTQTVKVAPLTSRTDYGKPDYGTAVSWTARVMGTNLRVQSSDGQEVVAYSVVWIGGVSGIQPGDQITLPDGSTPPILKVEQYPDESGACFEKVYLGAKGRK